MTVTMKIKDDIGTFNFKSIHPTIVNSFRRVILDDVPTFAIEDVEFVKNDSPLYEETIAHRLGLVPISTDLKTYNFKEDCKCGGIGCALCEVKMTLKKDGDGYVFTDSIQSNDPKVTVVDKEIPITKLFGDTKIEANLTAVLGTGRVHAKWAPAHTYLKENGKGMDLIVEPFGQLSAKDIYNKAIDVLITKVDELEGEL